eukprot:GILI01027600.1.p1 GENE.GILI01027600.1~~GILI01027600.1.p1  ORF type:complete len:471 (-),score=63.63 GILI01027600.1:113-1525(-)
MDVMSPSSTSACSKATSNKTELSETAFRLAEKHYKLFRLDHRASKRQTVADSDFGDAIDFHNLTSNTAENQQMMRLVSEIEVPLSKSHNHSLKLITSESEAKKHRPEHASGDDQFVSLADDVATTRIQRCYTFDGVPGLLFFPAALDEVQQQYWCGQALDRFAKSPPFPNNLTTLDPTLITERYGGPHRYPTTPAANYNANASASPSGTKTSGGGQQQQAPTKEKMRWATLGFKYNWTSKTYSPSEFCAFPANLSKMIKKTFFSMLAPVATSALNKGDAVAVAAATAKAVELAKGLAPCCNSGCEEREAGQLPAAAPITLLANQVAASHKALTDEEILSALLSPSYEPQTAIVNYFPVGTMMCAHQDLSEPCLHRPLISISLGSSCVFLMGTTSRDDKPFAFILRSGDIVAFTGPSRVAFHAVPRVLEDCPEHLVDFDTRMKGLRININVRQVYDEPQPQLAVGGGEEEE